MSKLMTCNYNGLCRLNDYKKWSWLIYYRNNYILMALRLCPRWLNNFRITGQLKHFFSQNMFQKLRIDFVQKLIDDKVRGRKELLQTFGILIYFCQIISQLSFFPFAVLDGFKTRPKKLRTRKQ